MIGGGWTRRAAIAGVALGAGTCLGQQSRADAEPRARTLLTEVADRDDDAAREDEFVIEPARERSSGLMGDLVRVDLGVTRLGEVSRALRAEGALGEIAGSELTPQQVNVVGIEGPVRVYNAEFSVDAGRAGPVELSLLGGVRAFGLSRQWTGVPGGSVSLDDDASDEIVPVPVFGGSMSVLLAEGLRLRGSAAGQAMDNGGTYLDLNAHSEWSITPQLDLIAGYQFLDAAVTGATTGARLHTDGLYAQFRLRF